MKHGLLVYKSYNNRFNIGDYIQSLAAKQFIPKVDFFVNREELNSYSGYPIQVIMNGWFLHEPKAWPPSDLIAPVFLSFHLNTDAYSILEEKISVEYMRNYEPIGCRDKTTVGILHGKGIKAYYTGCLTLTLGLKYRAVGKKRNTIYIVDPYFDRKRQKIRTMLTALRNFGKAKHIAKKMYKIDSLRLTSKKGIKYLLGAAAFFSQYHKVVDEKILLNADYRTHILKDTEFADEQKKIEYAEHLLGLYSEAKLVLTSRIHCALPCLAIGTPVIYVDNENKGSSSACRLSGLLELLNVMVFRADKRGLSMYSNRKISAGIEYANKNAHGEIANSLVERVTNAIENSEMDKEKKTGY